MNSSDLVLSLGCRLSPQLVGHDFTEFKNAKIIAIDVEKDELIKKGQKLNLPINCNLSSFFKKFLKSLKKTKLPKYTKWISYCNTLKKIIPSL